VDSSVLLLRGLDLPEFTEEDLDVLLNANQVVEVGDYGVLLVLGLLLGGRRLAIVHLENIGLLLLLSDLLLLLQRASLDVVLQPFVLVV